MARSIVTDITVLVAMFNFGQEISRISRVKPPEPYFPIVLRPAHLLAADSDELWKGFLIGIDALPLGRSSFRFSAMTRRRYARVHRNPVIAVNTDEHRFQRPSSDSAS